MARITLEDLESINKDIQASFLDGRDPLEFIGVDSSDEGYQALAEWHDDPMNSLQGVAFIVGAAWGQRNPVNEEN